MKTNIIFFINIASFLCLVQSDIIDDYVQSIEEFNNYTLDYVFPINNYKYLIKNENSSDYEGDKEFDFIIVGAGSTGAVIANRLSEVKQWNILLIEAGDYDNNITNIPDEIFYTRGSNYNWCYNVSSQLYSGAGYINNSVNIPQGKGVGGGSIINAMFDVRGNRDDYDKWAALGNPGWSYEDVLPYFIKSENVSFPEASPQYRGRHGYLNIELSTVFDELGEAYLNANEQLGRKRNKDYNGAEQMGVGILQNTHILGQRDSTGRAYILPFRNRQNLKILTNTLATKIEIHRETKKAYGVSFLRNGRHHFIKAKKEIIISAGAINTPQLLMVSGVGPEEHLKEHKIHVIKNLPVGQNFNDHLMYDPQSFTINYTYPDLPLRTEVELYLNGTGPLTTVRGMKALSFVNLNDPNSTVPEIEQIFLAGYVPYRPFAFYNKFNRYTFDTYNLIYEQSRYLSTFTIMSLQLHPRSRGNVTLKSKSVLEYPIVNPNYLSDPYDVQILVQAAKDQLKIVNTPALQKYNATVIKRMHPACNQTTWGTDEYYECMVRALATTQYHFAGTCQMGPVSDPNSVVDARLRVHGIQNLRVADASIIPVTISGHTNAGCVMIGEKAGDIIKKDYGII